MSDFEFDSEPEPRSVKRELTIRHYHGTGTLGFMKGLLIAVVIVILLPLAILSASCTVIQVSKVQKAAEKAEQQNKSRSTP